jgi:hypothetical protein
MDPPVERASKRLLIREAILLQAANEPENHENLLLGYNDPQL